MLWHVRIVVGLLVCSACVPAIDGSEPPEKAKVELRWVETKRIEGLTDDKGFQSSCDTKDVLYPHKRPALLLTVVVDGKYWGVRRYEKNAAPFVPEQVRADTFTPNVGFFSSKAEAQRLVDALK